MIRLKYYGQTETLPPAYFWVDEFAWAKKAMIVKRLLPQDGVSAAFIQVTEKSGGQTVTLAAENGPGMMSRGQLETLQGWSLVSPSPLITIEQDGRDTLTAYFDFQTGPAIIANPVFAMEPPQSDDWWYVTLKFIRS